MPKSGKNTMSAVAQVIKSVGPKLVPFFKTVAIYFVVLPPYEQASPFGTIIKCLPILSLMLFVVLHGMSLGEEYKYSRRILFGLIFSCIGDAFLVYPNCFEIGMFAFAVGHIHYILAFGFKPLKLKTAIVIYAICAIALAYLMPGLEGIIKPGVIIYTLIIATMVWRAIASTQVNEDMRTWSKLFACVGAIIFAVSDTILAVNKFRFPISDAQIKIMSTYYAGQLGIALSVLDAKSQPTERSARN